MARMARSKSTSNRSSSGSRSKGEVRFVKANDANRSRAKKTSASSRTKKPVANTRAQATEIKRTTTKTSKAKTSAPSKRTRTTSTTTGRTKSSKRSASPRSAVKSRTASTARRTEGGVPTWRELAESNSTTATQRMNADTWFSAISTTRFVVVVLAVATLFTLYVGHVFATQKLLTEVQQLRSEELALQMNRDKLEGDYQRVIGPTTIFSEATKLGLKDRAQFGEPIRLP